MSSPGNFSTGAAINASFSWSLAAGTLPETEEIQLASDSLFASVVYDDATIIGSLTSYNLTLTPNTKYFWRVRGVNFIGTGAWSTFRSFTTAGPLVAVYTILQGFYNSGTSSMRMRDTVNIELHNASSPFALVESHKAVFDSVTFSGQGLVVGRSSAQFSNAVHIGSNYYIAIKHRNAVETWSAASNPIPIAATMNYNFTDNQAEAYGSNLTQVGSVWCLYSGDVNQDGIVDSGDLGVVDNDNANYATGYLVTDVNGDGIVDSSDLGVVDNNNANYVGKIVPTGPPTAIRVTRPAKVKSVNQ